MRNRRGLVVLGLVPVLVAGAVLMSQPLILGSNGPSSRPTSMAASSPSVPSDGSPVFSDDFHSMTAGWVTGTPMFGESIQYGGGGYEITTDGSNDYYVDSPYLEPVSQLSVSVTASESATAATGNGFGVECSRGIGRSAVSYEFLVTSYEHAIIQKRTLGFYPKGLQEGSIPINPGPARLTIEGVCATLDDGQTTRLILFLDGQKITDFTDTTTDLPATGWTGGIEIQDTGQEQTLTVTNFEERDFSR